MAAPSTGESNAAFVRWRPFVVSGHGHWSKDMATSAPRLLTFEEWEARPETNRIEELIDGELIVNPPARWGHQEAVGELLVAMRNHAKAHGDGVVPAPFGIRAGERTVVEPDLVYFVGERRDFDSRTHTTRTPPDLVVEVLSPSNRSHDLLRKRRIFEEHGIREVWFVDWEAGLIEQVAIGDAGRFGPSAMHGAGDTLTSTAVPGLDVDVSTVLGLG